jgi:hypothetical protein
MVAMRVPRWAIGLSALAACGGGDTPATVDATVDTPSEVDAAGPTLGTVVPVGACTEALPTLLANARCEEVRVQCPGMADATARMVIGEPTGPTVGTVVFGSGSSGATLMEQATIRGDGTSAFVPELEALRAAGYRVIERAWQGGAGDPTGDDCSGVSGSFDVTVDRGWIRGTEGPDAAACRYATLLTYLHDRYDRDGAYCAVGFSGGSMELGMAVARWDRARLLDYALFVSGPVATFDDACHGSPGLSASCATVTAAQPWECGSTPPACTLGDEIRCLLDRAYAGDQVCMGGGADDAAALRADSVLAPGAPTQFPTTGLGVILGLRDCGSGAAIGGADFATRVTGADGPPTVDYISGAGHVVHRDPAGAARIASRVRAGCVP